MNKTLTALLLSSALLAPAAASAQSAPAAPRGMFAWVFAPKKAVRTAAAPSATEVVAGVQKFYAEIGQVKAKFRQEVTNSTFGRTDVSDGELWIKKPGKMRWQYFMKKRKGKPTGIAKDFISNGAFLYVVDFENKQVIKKDLQKNLLPTAITFLYGKGDLAADFTPAMNTSGTYGGRGDLVVDLAPKQGSTQYKTLHLVVDPATYRVKESIIVDSAGNKNHFRFYEPKFDAAVEDKWFEFSTNNPKVRSFRVVDGDKPATGATAPAPGSAAPAPGSAAPIAPAK